MNIQKHNETTWSAKSCLGQTKLGSDNQAYLLILKP